MIKVYSLDRFAQVVLTLMILLPIIKQFKQITDPELVFFSESRVKIKKGIALEEEYEILTELGR